MKDVVQYYAIQNKCIGGKMMKYYHMTNVENMISINESGLKKPVYMTDTVEGALMFAKASAMNGRLKDAAIFEIDSSHLKQSELMISEDHSRAFYDTDAFVYWEDIPAAAITLNNVYTIGI